MTKTLPMLCCLAVFSLCLPAMADDPGAQDRTTSATVTPLPSQSAAALGSPGEHPAERRSLAPAVVMGSVAFVGLIAGTITASLYATKHAEAKSLSDAIRQRNGQCYWGTASHDLSCGDLQTLVGASDRWGTASVVTFAIAAVANLGTLAYLLSLVARPSVSRVRLSSMVGSTGGSLLVSGSF